MSVRREILKNSSTTTLNGAINNSTTSVVVTTGSVLPSTGDFRILIDTEIMLVTARSTNTLTVVRGSEGTTAASHGDLADVALMLTQGAVQRYGRDNDPMHDTSRPPLGRLVNASNTILTSSDFSTVNIGTTTVTDQNGTILVRRPTQTTSLDLSLLVKTAPSTPYSIIAAFRACMPCKNSSLGSPSFGLLLRESSTGKFQTSRVIAEGSYSPLALMVSRFTNATSYSSTEVSEAHLCLLGAEIWLRVTDNATNLIFDVSHDGFNWIQLVSQSRTAFMAGGPNQVGFFADNYGNDKESLVTLVHWNEG